MGVGVRAIGGIGWSDADPGGSTFLSQAKKPLTGEIVAEIPGGVLYHERPWNGGWKEL
jgi:hypothetical protein